MNGYRDIFVANKEARAEFKLPGDILLPGLTQNLTKLKLIKKVGDTTLRYV